VIYAAVVLASGLLSIFITPVVRVAAVRLGVVDLPGARKIHSQAVPRMGGLAVAWAAVFGLAAVAAAAPRLGWHELRLDRRMLALFAGGGLVFAVGLMDDIRTVPPAVKVAVQVTAAGIVVASGVVIDGVTLGGVTYHLGWATVPVTLGWIVGITNAFNLIDGLDGLATGLAVIAAATCATILAVRGYEDNALVLVALLGAAAGFLLYNFHPASIFLGDSGSLLIGFALATTAIMGFQKGATALAVGAPLLIFALPIADTLASIWRRLVDSSRSAPSPGRLGLLASVVQADRRHIHHRLVAGGLSHRQAVLVLYALALGLSLLALFTIRTT